MVIIWDDLLSYNEVLKQWTLFVNKKTYIFFEEQNARNFYLGGKYNILTKLTNDQALEKAGAVVSNLWDEVAYLDHEFNMSSPGDQMRIIAASHHILKAIRSLGKFCKEVS